MRDCADVARTLKESLGLSLPPIAVTATDRVPEGVPLFDRKVPAGCRFWQEAAEGPFATVTGDHELCAIGVHTHNLQQPSEGFSGELARALEVMGELDYVREEEVAAIPRLEKSVRCVTYAPLAQAPLEPDAVLLFAQARQGLVVSEAVARVDQGAAPALGRPACAVIAQATRTGRAALSLGCCGARAYLDALTDDVALWALPGPRLAEYAAEISSLARANDTLMQFHELRRKDVESGGAPSVDESLARLGS